MSALLPRKNRRGRNPGRAVGQKPERVDARAMIVRKFDIPFEQRHMTVTEAHSIGLATIPDLAEKIGVHKLTIVGWKRRFDDFPKPIAKRHDPLGGTSGGGCFYSAHEVFEWTAAKIKSRHIHPPKTSQETRGV